MTVFAALLRGVNVSGKNKIKMAELREALNNAGLKNVETYIQSGNVIFESAKTSRSLEKIVANAIKQEFGYDVPVMVRDKSFLHGIVKKNPFKNLEVAFLSATILDSPPAKKEVDAIKDLDFGDERFAVKRDVVYLYLPNGSARTKLTNNFLEKKLSTKATSRNWRTIGKLIEMCNKG